MCSSDLSNAGAGGIGTPETMRKHLRGFAEAGVDQVSFIQQGGRNTHEHICEALDLFARDVMPEFKEHADPEYLPCEYCVTSPVRNFDQQHS